MTDKGRGPVPQMKKVAVPIGARVPTTVNPKDLDPFECSVCGAVVFTRACGVGRISALQSPIGQEAIGDFDIGYLCGGCGGHNTHVPSKEAKKQKERTKEALKFGASGEGHQEEKKESDDS